MGKSNATQVRDLLPNDGNEKTPAYAVYENGKFSKMALINYMTDPSGANDYTTTIFVGGSGWNEANGVPASVKVKYLLAPSTAEKNNVTWAGQVCVSRSKADYLCVWRWLTQDVIVVQTLGGQFASDGRWKGEENIQTVQCDQTANSCQIKVPAPGAALVFFSDDAQAAAVGEADVQTFATTVQTKVKNTVSMDPAVLATSNGDNGKNRLSHQGGTSFGAGNGAGSVVAPGLAVFVCMLAGMGMLMWSR